MASPPSSSRLGRASKKPRKSPRKTEEARETANDRQPQPQRRDYAAGADGEQDVNVGSAAAPKGKKDHSERESGGDQDIDTAGMVPGNKATDDEEPTGS